MQKHQKVFGLGLATLASLVMTPGAEAQRVSADIHIGAGPVAGVIRVGDGPRFYRPRHVIVEPAPRHIVVEHRRGWHPNKIKHAKVLIIYYDRGSRRYYDSYRRGFDRVRVYHDGRRYYRYDDDRYDRRDWDDRRDRDRDDRWDRDRDRDDRWDRDRDRNRDDRRDRDRRDRDRRGRGN